MKTLVADDDDAMRALVEAIMTAAGHDVVTVADGTKAWEHFEEARPTLVLLDWQMPGLSGIEVCERIRKSEGGRDTYVMMVTARGATADLLRLLDAGADDYLSKPLTPEALRSRVVIAERRIAIDQARRAAEDALAHAQWYAGIGETVIAVQHEINNPLTALLGNITLLSTGMSNPADEKECIRVIAEQAMRIATVVRRLGSLREPRSVEYVRGSKMLDLSGQDSGQ
jgi:two-component system NtrC family sensor kinase